MLRSSLHADSCNNTLCTCFLVVSYSTVWIQLNNIIIIIIIIIIIAARHLARPGGAARPPLREGGGRARILIHDYYNII